MQAFLVESLTPTVRSGVFAMTYATGVALLGGTTQLDFEVADRRTGIARSASSPESDVHAYNVLVAVDGRASRVAVDDSTGQVIADPSALSGF